MAKFLAAKHLGALRPVDEAGEDAMRKIGQGEILTVEVKQPRNIKHHRMFWALMSLVWQNLDNDRYPTVEDFVDAVKITVGHRKRIELPTGAVGFIPQSIAFNKMDQTEFSAFYERVCDAIAKYFLPGVTSEELRAEVETMTGMRVDGDQRRGRRAA